MTDTEIEKFLDRKAAEIGEYFDNVQILVSWRSEKGNGTRRLFRGCGDWYARKGLCHAFIDSDVASENADAMRPLLNPPDDGEQWKTMGDF